MIKALRYLRNKYILTLVLFSVYMLFLDDADIITIVQQRSKLSTLIDEKANVEEKYMSTKQTLDQLSSMEAIEKFAREEKMFKRTDEDVFILVYEE